METVRTFIAINIGAETRESLAELQQTLKKTGADVRWAKPENIHLTLAFLGSISTSYFQPLETALQKNLQRQEPFRISVHGTGVFGRRNRPSVVWAGIHDNPALLHLQHSVVSALDDAGIPFNHKSFRPHLTLGRFKTLNHLEALFQALEKTKETHFGTQEVASVQLIKSELKTGGAEYTVLSKTDLRP